MASTYADKPVTRTDAEWTALFRGKLLGTVEPSRERIEQYVERGVRAGNDRDDYAIVFRTRTTTTTGWTVPDAEQCALEGHPGGHGEPVVCSRCGQAFQALQERLEEITE